MTFHLVIAQSNLTKQTTDVQTIIALEFVSVNTYLHINLRVDNHIVHYLSQNQSFWSPTNCSASAEILILYEHPYGSLYK